MKGILGPPWSHAVPFRMARRRRRNHVEVSLEIFIVSGHITITVPPGLFALPLQAKTPWKQKDPKQRGLGTLGFYTLGV